MNTTRWFGYIVPVLLIGMTLFIGCSSEETSAPPLTPSYTAEVILEQIIQPQEANDLVLGHLLTAGMDTTAAMDSVLVLFLEGPNVAWGEAGDQGMAISYTSGMVGGIFFDPQDLPEIDVDVPEPASAAQVTDGSKALNNAPQRTIFLNAHYSHRAPLADNIIAHYPDLIHKYNSFDDDSISSDEHPGQYCGPRHGGWACPGKDFHLRVI